MLFRSVWNKEIKDVIQNNKSLALLSPKAKAVLRDITSKELVGGAQNMPFEDILDIRAKLDAEFKADYPKQYSQGVGVGSALLDLSWDDLRDQSALDKIGFTVRQLGNGESGYNTTLEITHNDSGQVFYVKRDGLADDYRIDPGSQEIAANALSRALGITGVYNTEVNKLDDLVLVQQRVGDYIPLGSELYTVSRYTNYDFTPSYLDTLVNPEDLLRLAILDGTIQNGDRHGGNLLVAYDPYYSKKFHLLPIDHSLSNLGPSNSSNFIDVGYTVVYQDIFNAFAKKIGNDNMKKLFEKIKGDFLSNFDKELSLLKIGRAHV